MRSLDRGWASRTDSVRYRIMYLDLSDNELLELISREKNKDAEETLIKRYEPLVIMQSRGLYIIGADDEDLKQEGMIGLMNAIRDFNPDKGAVFKTFAYLCIKRQMLNAVNYSNNKKHGPLNSYISIYGDGGNESSPLDDIDSSTTSNPEDILLAKQQESELWKTIDSKLSEFEKKVLYEYLSGASYDKIAAHLGKPTKSIDNAVQRIRSKLK